MSGMNTAFAGIAMLGIAGSAFGTVSLSQGASAPTYTGASLNFDEVGGPTGPGVPTNSWSGIGITTFAAGVGPGFVGDRSGEPGFGWLPANNTFTGDFGVFINFDDDVTEFSAQVWDNGGPASPFGGGMFVVALNDGVEVLFAVVEPGFGGVGDTWFDITTSGGMVFDELRFVGQDFAGPVTIIDNISFNSVPAPGAFAMLGLVGVAGARRRRA